MWSGRHYREGERSKVEMVWTCNKKSWSEISWNEEIRRCGVVDITEKVREARLRWYGHIIRRDEEELVRDIME
jgi:hypothetical protein